MMINIKYFNKKLNAIITTKIIKVVMMINLNN